MKRAKRVSDIAYNSSTDTLNLYFIDVASVYEEVLDNVFIGRKATNKRVRTGAIILGYKQRNDHLAIQKRLKFIDFESVNKAI